MTGKRSKIFFQTWNKGLGQKSCLSLETKFYKDDAGSRVAWAVLHPSYGQHSTLFLQQLQPPHLPQFPYSATTQHSHLSPSPSYCIPFLQFHPQSSSHTTYPHLLLPVGPTHTPLSSAKPSPVPLCHRNSFFLEVYETVTNPFRSKVKAVLRVVLVPSHS